MLGLVAQIAKLRARFGRPRKCRPGPGLRPRWEALEGREMLSGLGVDYTLMGGQWDTSRPVTFSVAPDGLPWDQGINNVNSQLNGEFGGTAWQGLVARALQTWAAATNLNFVQVGDGAYGLNTSGPGQGDARFGDIRIGGFNFGNNATIARTYGPPPNGQTGAGDVELNTSYNFGPNSSLDLESVILHELGHSLGLGESPQASSVMYTYYSGVRRSLSPYDVEGIQSIYGPRLADGYQSQGRGISPGSAVDLTPYLNAQLQTELGGVSLATIGDTGYFSVAAPAVNGATMRVAARASGISLLSPKVTVFDAATGAPIASAAQPSAYGDYVSVAIPNAQAGHHYLIAVTGATADVFAVGSYAVQLGFFGGTPISPPAPAPVPHPTPTPTPTPSPTPTPAPTPTLVSAVQPDRFEPNNSFATATELGPMGQTVVNNLTITSASDVRVFAFEVSRPGVVLVASANTSILVADFIGRPVAAGSGLIGFAAPTAGARYFLVFLTPNGAPVPNFGFAVATIPSPSVVAAAALPAATLPAGSTAKPHSSALKATPGRATPTGPGKPRRPHH